MKRAAVVITVIFCSFFAYVGSVEAKGVLPQDAAALLEMEGQSYYLAHNLHGDKFRKKVYSANYQLSGEVIPWGSEVKIIKIQRNFLSFREVKSGQIWNYWFSGRTRRAVRLEDHVQRVFIKDNEGLKAKVSGLSEVDRDGIYEGRALVGMSRSGVLVASGYPPEFANSKNIMKAREWKYWLSRFDKIKISFSRQGLVSRIVD